MLINYILRLFIFLGAALLIPLNAEAQKPEAPQYGMYWFKTMNDFRRADSHPDSSYFHPNKPTMIFVHGQQNNFIKDDKYERFNYREHDTQHGFDDDLAREWHKRGWNVGAFYWREFADDSVLEAESKIWSDKGIYGMRFKEKVGGKYCKYSLNGQYCEFNKHELPSELVGKTVTDLFYDSYRKAMKGYRGNNIRLVGHSLGNQLVVSTAERISNDARSRRIPANLEPDRIALLDPFYSNQFKPFWRFSTTGEKGAAAAEKLRDRGVIFEVYQNSITVAAGQVVGVLTFDDQSMQRIRNLGAHQDMKPWYISDVPFKTFKDIRDKHVSAPFQYLQTIKYSPPDEVKLGARECFRWFCYWNPLKRVKTGTALSAATPDWRVKSMMTDRYYWTQVEGRYSNDTVDDKFEKKRRW